MGTWVKESCAFILSVCFICRIALPCSILDIEYEMTQFAFYYVGIGAAVFLLGYFQVRLRSRRTSRLWSPRLVISSVSCVTDLSVGDSCCQTDSAHQEDVLQESDEDGDRLVRLHLRRRAQHAHVGVSAATTPFAFDQRDEQWWVC